MPKGSGPKTAEFKDESNYRELVLRLATNVPGDAVFQALGPSTDAIGRHELYLTSLPELAPGSPSHLFL